MKLLAPYRDRINTIDRQIIDLLRARYDVIEEVGVLKTEHGIEPVLQDRVDEVREQAGAWADDAGLDGGFIRTLWAQIIEHSCNMEEDIRANIKEKQAQS